MVSKTLKMLHVMALLAFAQGVGAVPNAPTPEALVAGFEQRVEAMFSAESGKPLVRAKKQKPLGPDRNSLADFKSERIGEKNVMGLIGGAGEQRQEQIDDRTCTPLFPPSDPARRLPQRPPSKSKLLTRRGLGPGKM